LTERTCRDLDTVGMLCGSPANPSSISKNAMESAAQSTAPSGASLRSDTGEVQSANDSVADSFHSSGQEGSNIEASIANLFLLIAAALLSISSPEDRNAWSQDTLLTQTALNRLYVVSDATVQHFLATL